MSLKQFKRDSGSTGSEWNKPASGTILYLCEKSINMFKIIGTLFEHKEGVCMN
jgi:hypothetical protein